MKTIIVTGATRGLGLAIARQAAADGYKVVAVGRSLSNPLQDLIQQNPISVFFEQYDFLDLIGIHAFSVHIVKEHGRPWALVNNAALGNDGVLATFHEHDISALIRDKRI